MRFYTLLSVLALCGFCTASFGNEPQPGLKDTFDPFRAIDKVKSDAELVATLRENGNSFDANLCRKGNPLICQALETGRGREVIEVLVDLGADVNATNSEGRTVLMVALEERQGSDVVSFLVERGADCNAREPKTGKTPLMFAVDNDADSTTVERLVSSDAGRSCGNANLLALDAEGHDFSRYASKREKKRLPFLFERLDTARARQDETMRSISKEPDPVRVGERVRLESDWRATDSSGRTLLMLMAANNDNPEVVQLALQNGCSILERDDMGWKPADFAVAKNQRLDIVKLLVNEEQMEIAILWILWERTLEEIEMEILKNGMIGIMMRYGKTIKEIYSKLDDLDGSVAASDFSVQKAGYMAFASGGLGLLFADAHVDRIDELLAVAASNTKNTEILDFLLDQNAEINQTDKYGISPLMCAVANNPDPRIALHLLEKGANPDAHTVEKVGTSDRSSYLRWTFPERDNPTNSFRIAEETIFENTPVCTLACMADAPLDTLNALIENGADTKAHDVKGTTCLMMACKHSRRPEVVLRLLDPDLSSPELKSENGKGPKAWDFWQNNQWLSGNGEIEKKFSGFKNFK